jgi:hypothetical protein
MTNIDVVHTHIPHDVVSVIATLVNPATLFKMRRVCTVWSESVENHLASLQALTFTCSDNGEQEFKRFNETVKTITLPENIKEVKLVQCNKDLVGLEIPLPCDSPLGLGVTVHFKIAEGATYGATYNGFSFNFKKGTRYIYHYNPRSNDGRGPKTTVHNNFNYNWQHEEVSQHIYEFGQEYRTTINVKAGTPNVHKYSFESVIEEVKEGGRRVNEFEFRRQIIPDLVGWSFKIDHDSDTVQVISICFHKTIERS